MATSIKTEPTTKKRSTKKAATTKSIIDGPGFYAISQNTNGQPVCALGYTADEAVKALRGSANLNPGFSIVCKKRAGEVVSVEAV